MKIFGKKNADKGRTGGATAAPAEGVLADTAPDAPSAPVMAAVNAADLMDVYASVDNQVADISLSAEQARRKAAQWMLTPEGTVKFSFGANVSGYLVERGNLPNFSKPAAVQSVDLTGYTTVSVEAALEKHQLARASVGLYCFLCNAAGDILLKSKIGCETGQGGETMSIPPGTTGMCFALRLEGEGGFSGLSLTILRRGLVERGIESGADAAPAPTDDSVQMQPTRTEAAQELDLREKVDTLVDERNFGAAVALIRASVPEMTDAWREVIIQCHAAAHRFDDVLAEFGLLSPQRQAETVTRLHYLRAMLNSGMNDAASTFIEDLCLKLDRDQRDIEFLVQVYRFAVYLSRGVERLVLARILASAHQLTRRNLVPMLRCAHDLAVAERYEEFYRLTDIIASFTPSADDEARLNILSSQLAFSMGRYDRQLDCLNKALDANGMAPLCLHDTYKPLSLDRIYCADAQPRSVRGPMVSVIVPAYNCADTVEYALRSLMGQTYADLQILVVDDASTDGTAAKLRSLKGEDSRIKVITLPANSGSYVARNAGLSKAIGDFVTCQDADDWAHPQKIATMVEAMSVDESAIATAVRHVRYDPRKGYQPRAGYIRPDTSSILFRREKVMERIGYFDSVRAGGDSEFQFRLERAFGKAAFIQLPHILSLVSWSETTLSGGGAFAIDDDAGIFSAPRNAYRRALCAWQEQADRLFIDFPQKERPFDVVQSMLPGRKGKS